MAATHAVVRDPADQRAYRLSAIDMVRGLVIVIMAIDHVRDFTIFGTGRVPFAFYVPHFLLIHVMAVLLGIAQGFEARQFFTIFFFFPRGYGVGLPGVYALWAVVIIVLYPLCRWVAAVKARRRDGWLSYL